MRWNKEYIAQHTPWLIHLKEKYNIDTEYIYNPCMDNWTPKYMNRMDVLKAIHADSHYTRAWPSKPPLWHYGSEKADTVLLFPGFLKELAYNDSEW